MDRRTFLKGIGMFTVVSTAVGCTTMAVKRAFNPYYNGPKSINFDGLKFFNPKGVHPKGFGKLLKWIFLSEKKTWPKHYPSPFDDIPPKRVFGDQIRISFVGHATVLIQTAGLNILTDPVWSKRASPVSFAGPKRVNPAGIKFENLPPIDYVLLSHNHYDHLDLATLDKLTESHNPQVITALGNDTILNQHNPKIKVKAYDWGDTVSMSDDVKVTLEPMHHWSARGINDRRFALWAAFMLQGPMGNIYHIGDTGFHEGINYKNIAEKYKKLRLAILPFGAYEPRDFMKAQHQNPDEAVQGHILCNAEYTLGHHWGTFQLTNESIEDQLQHLDEARQKHGVAAERFRALQPGQVWDVPVV